ncbi:MAG: Lsr2 family protein [Micropruina sp.]|nr:Lsr2 family protein [Micropruina sp.]
MAQRVLYVLEDDLDKSEASETVAFGLDSATYEIDLSESNAAALRQALAAYVAVARRVGGKKKAGGRGRKSSGGGSSATEIRAWAVGQGLSVSSRGRVPAEIREAYDNAHS